MDAISFAGLLLSLPRLYAFACALVLLLASQRWVKLPSRRHAAWLNGTLLSWLLGARLVHVLLHLEAYRTAPLAPLMLWQPGYHALGGLGAALLWSLWYLRDTLKPRLVAVTLLLISHATWFALDGWKPFSTPSGLSQLPSLTLEDLAGQPVALDALAGRPVIINLWASWCPPCRREMPLLAELAERDDVTVVIVNQGESLLEVLRFLDDRRLAFHHALLDPQQRLMALSHAPGLPLSLLFNGDGQLIEAHIGELTRAQWRSWQTLADRGNSHPTPAPERRQAP